MLKRIVELPLWIAFYTIFGIILILEKLRGKGGGTG
jgi:hypothetical protein